MCALLQHDRPSECKNVVAVKQGGGKERKRQAKQASSEGTEREIRVAQ